MAMVTRPALAGGAISKRGGERSHTWREAKGSHPSFPPAVIHGPKTNLGVRRPIDFMEHDCRRLCPQRTLALDAAVRQNPCPWVPSKSSVRTWRRQTTGTKVPNPQHGRQPPATSNWGVERPKKSPCGGFQGSRRGPGQVCTTL